MPLYQETTYHDRQSTSSIVPQATTLIDTYEDIVGASITTKNVAEMGNYMLFFTILVSASSNNTTINIQAIVDGSPVGDSDLVVRFKDADIGYTFVVNLDNVICCEPMKLRIKTDQGVVTVVEFNMAVDGVPSERVVVV